MNKEQNKKEIEKIEESIYDSIKMYFSLMTAVNIIYGFKLKRKLKRIIWIEQAQDSTVRKLLS